MTDPGTCGYGSLVWTVGVRMGPPSGASKRGLQITKFGVYLAMILLLSLLSSAFATPICGLSQTEVEGLLSYYGSSYTWSEVSGELEGPFECGNHGTLCEDVGIDRAEEFVCNRWDDLRAHKTVAQVKAAAASEYSTMEDAYIAERWPNGIPSVAPAFWGTAVAPALPPPPACSKVSYSYSTGGTERVRGKSFYTLAFAYNDIGVSTKVYKKVSGVWVRESGSVMVQGVYDGDGCSVTGTDYDTDGAVYHRYSAVATVPLYNHVDGTHQFYQTGSTLTTYTCNTAPWAPGC